MTKAHPVLNCLKKRDKRYPNTKISKPLATVQAMNRSGPKPAYNCDDGGLSRKTTTAASQAKPNRTNASIIILRRAAAFLGLFSRSSPTILRLPSPIRTVERKRQPGSGTGCNGAVGQGSGKCAWLLTTRDFCGRGRLGR